MKIEQALQIKHFENEQQKVHLNILFTASWLKTQINQFLKNYQLSQEQFNVLRILRGQHPSPLCLKDITLRMIDKSSNTTRIIEKLVEKALVSTKKSEQDKRELDICLLPKALDLLSEIDAEFANKNLEWSNLSETEAQLLNALLDKMRDGVKDE